MKQNKYYKYVYTSIIESISAQRNGESLRSVEYLCCPWDKFSHVYLGSAASLLIYSSRITIHFDSIGVLLQTVHELATDA